MAAVQRTVESPLVAEIELSDNLIALETAAWAEIRDGALAVETATAVQAAITAHAQATGQQRYAVEMALKARVRHAAEAA